LRAQIGKDFRAQARVVVHNRNFWFWTAGRDGLSPAQVSRRVRLPAAGGAIERGLAFPRRRDSRGVRSIVSTNTFKSDC
jgi:hypothetical protein